MCVCLVAPRAALMQWDPQPPPCSALVGETLSPQDGSGQGVRIFTVAGWSRASGLQSSGTSFAWQAMAIPGPRCHPGRLGCAVGCCGGPHPMRAHLCASVCVSACLWVHVSCMPVHTCTHVYLSACGCVRKCASVCVCPTAACSTHPHKLGGPPGRRR